MESEDPDDCRESFLEVETEVREEPVVFNESLWGKSSGKILRQHFEEYKKKPDLTKDFKSHFKFAFGCILLSLM